MHHRGQVTRRPLAETIQSVVRIGVVVVALSGGIVMWVYIATWVLQ